MAEAVADHMGISEVLDLERKANLRRRSDSLRTLRFGWLFVGAVALLSTPFFPQYRTLASVIMLTTFTTFLAVATLQKYQKINFAGWVFVISVDLSFLLFFLVEVRELGAAEAFHNQATLLALMGLAVVFSGNQIGRIAAVIVAGLNSAMLLTLMFYFGTEAVSDPRFSLHILWWLLALATWVNETNLGRALDGLLAYRLQLEQRVKERTSELEAANRQLQALNAAKDEFVSNVSHELRTPVTSLKLTHNLLERTMPGGEHSRYFATAKRETDRLQTMIESLLLLSRFDQATVGIRFSQVDINPLVKEYVGDRIPLAQEREIDLSVELEAEPCRVWADERFLGQVLSILLTNAINYTPPGGQVRVRTISDRSKADLCQGFSVQDTGLGILPEDRDQLFTRFFRGRAAHELNAPGTGLGLAIAKEIIDRHDGRLEVHSAGVSGEGATFHVWLRSDQVT